MKQRAMVILDGGMGRELQRSGAPFRQPEWSALALSEAPEAVVGVHAAFIAAGAQVITSNSYAVVPFHIGEERFAKEGRQLANIAGQLARHAADCYNLLGSPQEFVQWAGVAHEAGFATWRGTGMDLGIRDVSSVHAAIAAGSTLPCDVIGNLLREDDLVLDPIRTEGGFAFAPEAPGLGVELDPAAVERYAVR